MNHWIACWWDIWWLIRWATPAIGCFIFAVGTDQCEGDAFLLFIAGTVIYFVGVISLAMVHP